MNQPLVSFHHNLWIWPDRLHNIIYRVWERCGDWQFPSSSHEIENYFSIESFIWFWYTKVGWCWTKYTFFFIFKRVAFTDVSYASNCWLLFVISVGSKNRTMAQEDLHLHLLVKWFHARLVRKTINYSFDRAKSENSWLAWLFD